MVLTVDDLDNFGLLLRLQDLPLDYFSVVAAAGDTRSYVSSLPMRSTIAQRCSRLCKALQSEFHGPSMAAPMVENQEAPIRRGKCRNGSVGLFDRILSKSLIREW